VLAAAGETLPPESFPDFLDQLLKTNDFPGFIAELAHLEWLLYQKKNDSIPTSDTVESIVVNPTLTLLPVSWKNLTELIRCGEETEKTPERKAGHLICWLVPGSGEVRCRDAEHVDLLALKLIVEGTDLRFAAQKGSATIGQLQNAMGHAVEEGLLLSPQSLIRRPIAGTAKDEAFNGSFLSADIFTLQWHVTQACDLHCKHCYDRSDRSPMPLTMAMDILDGLFDFCQRMHVRGQVTFTGGNPLLYPHVEEVYNAASDYGFDIAILGNPTPIERIKNLMEIARPVYFQISLEGLAEHNDHIRGKGHFTRSLAFLDGLRSLGIYTMVMLTLTRDNLDQVLPLAELLRDRADAFTFNRLSTVGEGANLFMPEKDEFEAFLRRYMDAAAKNPIMGLKDNLFNIIRSELGEEPFGGCTGYGCGAAFNFLAVLPDGEVHACRKFPSRIGNLQDGTLYDIYHSEKARRYRSGSLACSDCRLNPVCRGCLAIVHSAGLDVFKDKDPFCFLSYSIS
jgi:selenobiotic family peptide radical SAM maturase